MWIKDNITRTGKQVWYEAEIIDRIKTICKEAMDNFECEEVSGAVSMGKCSMAQSIIYIIESYEGEG